MATFVLALVLALSAVFPAKAESLEDLYAIAIEYGDYKEKCKYLRSGCPMPNVILTEHMEATNVGEFTYLNPTVVAIAADKAGSPGTPVWNAVLVHEFTHYLQWRTGKLGPSLPCQAGQEAEIEAYAAASKYLTSRGVAHSFKDQLFGVALMCVEG